MDSRALFVGLIGAPYESDLLTTAVRLADAAVRQRHRVTVWTCGYATALTVNGLGETKPRNPWAWDATAPSTAALVRGWLAAAGGGAQWLVCRFCAHERGALDQMPEVRLQPAANFLRRANAADVCLILGVK